MSHIAKSQCEIHFVSFTVVDGFVIAVNVGRRDDAFDLSFAAFQMRHCAAPCAGSRLRVRKGVKTHMVSGGFPTESKVDLRTQSTTLK